MNTERPRRSSLGRLVAAIVLSVVIAGLSTVAVLAAVVYHAGTVDVEIWEEQGEHVSISVPSTVVTAALKFLPASVCVEAAEEIAPYWEASQAAARELMEGPDAVWVEVTGPDLLVRVAKEDGELRVQVDDGGTRVHVSVPIDIVADIIDKIDSVL